MKRTRPILSFTVVGLLALTACGSPLTASVPEKQAEPAAVQQAATGDENCADGQPPTASIQPDANSGDVSSLADSETYQRILRNGHLTVGTSADVLLWGATDLRNGNLEGFDIDVLKEVAKALDKPITYKVITYGQRLPSLADGSVDLVGHTMTINCDRWEGAGTASAPNAINFSTEYYEAGQRVLVRTNSTATNIKALKGQRVCVPAGSTNVGAVQNLGLNLVQLDEIGDCLVEFQEGEVDAITGDDTVLAGFVKQDPYAKMVGPKFTTEPYGLGINAGDVAFTKFVNAVLQKMRNDGRLAAIYRQTMGTVTTAAFTPPTPLYDRNVGKLGRKP